MAETDWVKEILNEPSPPKQEKEVDWVKAIFEDAEPSDIGGTYQPKKAGPDLPPGAGGPISAITGKPETTYVPGNEPSAGIIPMVKAGFVDDPKKQIEIYAEARGISPSRYRIHNGEIIFRDKEGHWQRETGELPLSILKKGAVQTATNPAVILGTVGAVLGGPALAGVMAAGGEGARKVIGSQVFGEEQTSTGNALDMGVQGVLAAGGELVGKGIAVGLRKMLLGSKPAQYAGKEVVEGILTGADHAKAQVIQALARKHGIELAPHQLYDKEGMTNIWMYLRKHPSTSDAIRTFEDKLATQSDAAIEGFVRDMGGYDETPFMIGKKLSEAAGKSIESAKDVRRIAASPLYQKAFKAGAEVDIKPVIEFIDTELATAKGEVRAQLLRAKKILEKPDLPKVTTGEKPVLVDEAGKPLGGTPTIEEWETSLQGLHGSKIEFDRIIENARQDSLGNTVKRNYQNIQKLLLGQMDSASPEYAAARARFAQLSEPVEALKKSVLGELEKIGKEGSIAKAPHKLLDVANMPDAELLRRARQSIEPQDPELWRDMVGSYIRDIYEGLKVTEEGKVLNVAGKMHKRLFGSTKQREIMKAAMSPDDYKALEDLMTVFQRAAVGTSRQSMTQPFAQIEKQITGPLLSTVQGNIAKAAKHPWDTAVDTLFETLAESKLAGRQQTLLSALTSPDALEQIKRLKPLSPGSKQLIEGIGAYLALITPKIGIEDIGSKMPGER